MFSILINGMQYINGIQHLCSTISLKWLCINEHANIKQKSTDQKKCTIFGTTYFDAENGWSRCGSLCISSLNVECDESVMFDDFTSSTCKWMSSITNPSWLTATPTKKPNTRSPGTLKRLSWLVIDSILRERITDFLRIMPSMCKMPAAYAQQHNI